MGNCQSGCKQTGGPVQLSFGFTKEMTVISVLLLGTDVEIITEQLLSPFFKAAL